jgi:CDGSH-type Zn-finger protein
MTQPACPQNAPYVLQESPGERWWCACGRSKRQPFCDGSHAGSGISPIPVTIEKARTVAWCGCKRTGKKPFCDGSHSRV